MANNYTQIYVQLVFAVSGRASLIRPEFEDNLYRYINGIITKRKHTVIAINGLADHIHILIGLHPDQSISDLVRDIKSNSSRYVNESKWIAGRFEWQRGYGAFLYSKSHVEQVKHYVEHQKAHHAKWNFESEMKHILDSLGIPYENEYMFQWISTDY
ncbi:MAG TPA: IS200/IS605 family transposase [Candidatus Kapabacteria bacterium]|jgi:REP element-mobilizing transposase RayT|nr:IS200/IS605 family transposase [Candidatus Kapabacteria bacterium]